MIRIFASLLLVALVPYACKKKDDGYDSSVKGVENFTNGEGVAQIAGYCGASSVSNDRQRKLDAWLSGKVRRQSSLGLAQVVDSEILKEIYQTLDLVPESALRLMSALKVEVVLSEGPLRSCDCSQSNDENACEDSKDSGFFGQFQQQEMYSCYTKKSGSQTVKILLGSVQEKSKVDEYVNKRGLAGKRVDGAKMIIRRELVRTIGLIYSRHLRQVAEELDANAYELSLVRSSNESEAVHKGLADLHKRRQLLEEAFLADIEASRLSKEAKDNVKKVKRDSEAVEMEFFKDYLVSEVFDSYYCNMPGRDSLAHVFNLTHNSFVSGFVKVDLEP
jgi:hypothetical protein